MKLPNKKPIRLKNYDYSEPGAYFITICTKGRKPILSRITVGTGILDRPQNILSSHGEIANNQIKYMNGFYPEISVDKYVIMPNHIHLLLRINSYSKGRSGRPVPTSANSSIAKFVGTFKRFCNRQYETNIWQSRSHDHIIRNKKDYDKIWEYIDTNVDRWDKDCFYTKN